MVTDPANAVEVGNQSFRVLSGNGARLDGIVAATQGPRLVSTLANPTTYGNGMPTTGIRSEELGGAQRP